MEIRQVKDIMTEILIPLYNSKEQLVFLVTSYQES